MPHMTAPTFCFLESRRAGGIANILSFVWFNLSRLSKRDYDIFSPADHSSVYSSSCEVVNLLEGRRGVVNSWNCRLLLSIGRNPFQATTAATSVYSSRPSPNHVYLAKEERRKRRLTDFTQGENN